MAEVNYPTTFVVQSMSHCKGNDVLQLPVTSYCRTNVSMLPQVTVNSDAKISSQDVSYLTENNGSVLPHITLNDKGNDTNTIPVQGKSYSNENDNVPVLPQVTVNNDAKISSQDVSDSKENFVSVLPHITLNDKGNDTNTIPVQGKSYSNENDNVPVLPQVDSNKESYSIQISGQDRPRIYSMENNSVSLLPQVTSYFNENNSRNILAQGIQSLTRNNFTMFPQVSSRLKNNDATTMLSQRKFYYKGKNAVPMSAQVVPYRKRNCANMSLAQNTSHLNIMNITKLPQITLNFDEKYNTTMLTQIISNPVLPEVTVYNKGNVTTVLAQNTSYSKGNDKALCTLNYKESDASMLPQGVSYSKESKFLMLAQDRPTLYSKGSKNVSLSSQITINNRENGNAMLVQGTLCFKGNQNISLLPQDVLYYKGSDADIIIAQGAKGSVSMLPQVISSNEGFDASTPVFNASCDGENKNLLALLNPDKNSILSNTLSFSGEERLQSKINMSVTALNVANLLKNVCQANNVSVSLSNQTTETSRPLVNTDMSDAKIKCKSNELGRLYEKNYTPLFVETVLEKSNKIIADNSINENPDQEVKTSLSVRSFYPRLDSHTFTGLSKEDYTHVAGNRENAYDGDNTILDDIHELEPAPTVKVRVFAEFEKQIDKTCKFVGSINNFQASFISKLASSVETISVPNESVRLAQGDASDNQIVPCTHHMEMVLEPPKIIRGYVSENSQVTGKKIINNTFQINLEVAKRSDNKCLTDDATVKEKEMLMIKHNKSSPLGEKTKKLISTTNSTKKVENVSTITCADVSNKAKPLNVDLTSSHIFSTEEDKKQTRSRTPHNLEFDNLPDFEASNSHLSDVDLTENIAFAMRILDSDIAAQENQKEDQFENSKLSGVENVDNVIDRAIDYSMQKYENFTEDKAVLATPSTSEKSCQTNSPDTEKRAICKRRLQFGGGNVEPSKKSRFIDHIENCSKDLKPSPVTTPFLFGTNRCEIFNRENPSEVFKTDYFEDSVSQFTMSPSGHLAVPDQINPENEDQTSMFDEEEMEDEQLNWSTETNESENVSCDQLVPIPGQGNETSQILAESEDSDDNTSDEEEISKILQEVDKARKRM